MKKHCPYYNEDCPKCFPMKNDSPIEKTAPKLRQEVYAFLTENGVDLPAVAKGKLSKILKSVYEHRVIESIENSQPIVHHIECPKCLGVVIKTGKAGKKYVQMRNKAKEKLDSELSLARTEGERVGREKERSEVGKAVQALYKIVGMNQITPDIVASASFMLKSYEQERNSKYIRSLVNEINELRDALKAARLPEVTT